MSARFGGFEVLARIGAGGMGEVFRARRVARNAPDEIALKLMRPEHANEPRLRQLFTTEAQVGALLDHPNIVRVIEFGEHEGFLFLALELVDGVSLARLLTRGPLPPGLAGYIVLRLLDALEYAHSLVGRDGRPLRFVHRDVSSANVLVSRTGQIKLADFGVAKVPGESLTLTGEVKGKRTCMAPEQLHGGAALDRRADVFAAGVLFHRMVFGRGPFLDVAEWVAGGAQLQARGPFANVIATAMARNPSDRYPTAAAFAAALRPILPAAPNAAAELAEMVRVAQRVDKPIAAIEELVLAEIAQAVARPGPGALRETDKLSLASAVAETDEGNVDDAPTRKRGSDRRHPIDEPNIDDLPTRKRGSDRQREIESMLDAMPPSQEQTRPRTIFPAPGAAPPRVSRRRVVALLVVGLFAVGLGWGAVLLFRRPSARDRVGPAVPSRPGGSSRGGLRR